MTRRVFGMVGLFAMLAVGAFAQDDKKDDPKAKPGKSPLVPATFRAFLVTDDRYPAKKTPVIKAEDRDPRDRTGKIHCLVCEHGPNPVVAIFVRTKPDENSGVSELARAMNKLIPTYRPDKLAAYVMFLHLDGEYPDDEERDVKAKDVRDLATGVKATNVPFGLAPTKSTQIDGWGIGEKDDVTVIFYRGLRVVKKWTFPADGPSKEQIDEIKKEVETEINK